jgi:hypothetical protein
MLKMVDRYNTSSAKAPGAWMEANVWVHERFSSACLGCVTSVASAGFLCWNVTTFQVC